MVYSQRTLDGKDSGTYVRAPSSVAPVVFDLQTSRDVGWVLAVLNACVPVLIRRSLFVDMVSRGREELLLACV